MSKTTKIAISLPEEVLTAVEREREGSGESRSQIFRRAVIPETNEEVAAARHAATTILAEEPWQ